MCCSVYCTPSGDLSRLGEEWGVLERYGVAAGVAVKSPELRRGLMPASLAGTKVGVGFENTGMGCFITLRIATAFCLTFVFFPYFSIY